MADAQDLKSWDRKTSCGFESRHRHQNAINVNPEPSPREGERDRLGRTGRRLADGIGLHTKYTIDPQQTHPTPGKVPILPVTATAIFGQPLPPRQQFPPHRIQTHTVTRPPQMPVGAALDGQRLAAAAEQMPNDLCFPLKRWV